KIVCYFPNWSQYRGGNGKFTGSDIDPHLCSHLIVAFGLMESNTVTYLEWNDEALYKQLRQHKSSNPDLKVLVAVGGWNAGSGAFIEVCQSKAAMTSFANNVVTFLRREYMDGLDLDWEYPSNSGVQGKRMFTDLAQVLQDAFKQDAIETGKPKLLLTAATAAGISTVQASYDLPKLAGSLDFLNLMAYDLHGPWDAVTGYSAALFTTSPGDTLNVKSIVDFYLNNGFPADKLVLGIPIYGRTWTLTSSFHKTNGASARGPGLAKQFTREPGYAAYYEICSEDWPTVYDADHQAAYAHHGDQWVSYDTPRIVANKADFIIAMGLAGAMFWDVTLDDFHNICGDGPYPIINAVKQTLEDTELRSSALQSEGIR
ncbi:hypothetical protein CAPTEDRAFT_96206, partial [Capitella teleta]